MLKQKKHIIYAWLAIFVAVVLSRLATTIYYLEDPDSYRFALGVVRFDLVNLQPHFPGYPVFIGLAKPLYAVLSSFALSFSLIGALAASAIAYFLFDLANKFNGKNDFHWLIPALVFFNPLIWVMSTRYMPDLLGASLVFAVFWAHFNRNSHSIYPFLVVVLSGLLAGTRLSYMPFVVLPVLHLLWERKQRFILVGAGIISVLVWLAPMVLITGWDELIQVAQKHTSGHFNDFGGAVAEGENYLKRIIKTTESLWADGFGGYWQARSWVTLFVFPMLGFAILGVGIKPKKFKLEYNILLLSAIAYFLWIFFYQNVVYKPRHVLPLIPLIIFWMVVGMERLRQYKSVLVLSAISLAAYGFVGVKTGWSHKSPSAIAKAGEFLKTQVKPDDVVVSTELAIEYLQAYNLEGRFEDMRRDYQILDSIINTGDKVYAVGLFDREFSKEPSQKQVFYHNPYVNRMWSKMEVWVFNE